MDKISPCLQLLNSIGQWQRSGVLSDKEDGLKGTALDDLCRLAGSIQVCLMGSEREICRVLANSANQVGRAAAAPLSASHT
jgi:hypothetical protein